MVRRMQRQIGYTESSDHLHKKDVYDGFRDWKIWVFAVAQFGVDVILYGYSTFLPTNIRGLGKWSRAEVQALTIPCYALGAGTYILVAWLSDRSQRQMVSVVALGLVPATGYACAGRRQVFRLLHRCHGPVCHRWYSTCLATEQQPTIWKEDFGKVTIGNSAGIPAPFVS